MKTVNFGPQFNQPYAFQPARLALAPTSQAVTADVSPNVESSVSLTSSAPAKVFLMEAPKQPATAPLAVPSQAESSGFLKGLKKVALFAGTAALLGAGMATGGAGGLVCGALAGAMFGGTTIGSIRPGGGGISAHSFLGPLGGMVAGGVLGAMGLPNGAAICGTAMAVIQSVRSWRNITM